MRIQLDHVYDAAEIAAAVGAPPPEGGGRVNALTTDSREVQEGDLFVALCGEREDGHRYLEAARARGASLLLCERATRGATDTILVQSSEDALAALAASARRRIDPLVVAVTGSVGKTTTKDMIAAVLATRFRTHATPGNYNNLLGLSLTLLSMPADTEVLVLELGMNHAREIARLSEMARPDVAVITNVGTAHIGNLGSREAIARAKLELLEGCNPGTPYLFPADEPLLAPPCHACTLPCPVGGGEGARGVYRSLRFTDTHTVVDVSYQRTQLPALSIPGVGEHIALSATFAVCVGCMLGVRAEGIRLGLGQARGAAMRGQIAHVGGVTVIEDCYNSSPESVRASLTVLRQQAGRRGGRCLALLGDMRELGAASRRLHEEVGRVCRDAGVDLLFTFGPRAEWIADGARAAGMEQGCIFRNPQLERPEESATQLLSQCREGDVLLCKASRACAAERVLTLLKKKYSKRKDGEK